LSRADVRVRSRVRQQASWRMWLLLNDIMHRDLVLLLLLLGHQEFHLSLHFLSTPIPFIYVMTRPQATSTRHPTVNPRSMWAADRPRSMFQFVDHDRSRGCCCDLSNATIALSASAVIRPQLSILVSKEPYLYTQVGPHPPSSHCRGSSAARSRSICRPTTAPASMHIASASVSLGVPARLRMRSRRRGTYVK
jgi:hypothetical protein